MAQKISVRLLEIVNTLPFKKGMRILEIGCGTGVMARAIANQIGSGKVLAIDRSAKAIELAKKNSSSEISSGRLQFVHAKIEAFELPKDEPLYDIAFGIRVGALDGRHPEIQQQALANISKSLKKNGKLFIDGGNPLKEIKLRGINC